MILRILENFLRKLQGNLSVEKHQQNIDGVFYSQQNEIKKLRKKLKKYVDVPDEQYVEKYNQFLNDV